MCVANRATSWSNTKTYKSTHKSPVQPQLLHSIGLGREMIGAEGGGERERGRERGRGGEGEGGESYCQCMAITATDVGFYFLEQRIPV